MKVTAILTNGVFKIHKTGCGDIGKAVRRGVVAAQDLNPFEADDQTAVVADLWSDILNEASADAGDVEATWDACDSETDFLGCTKGLPVGGGYAAYAASVAPVEVDPERVAADQIAAADAVDETEADRDRRLAVADVLDAVHDANRTDADVSRDEQTSEHDAAVVDADADAVREADEAEVEHDVAPTAYQVTATGAKVALYFPAGGGQFTPTLDFATLADVDAFLATDLRSAWAVSEAGDWKRRGVHLLTVTDATTGATVKTHDPRPVKATA